MTDKQAEHELKTDPEVFQAVWSGAKTHEIRKDDRGFAVGDTLWLRETKYTGQQMRVRPEACPLVYTGRELRRTVSHILTGYGLSDHWCILSFAPESRSTEVGDEQIEALFQKCGGRWDGGPDAGRWVIEDADLHPFVRTVLATQRSTEPAVRGDAEALRDALRYEAIRLAAYWDGHGWWLPDFFLKEPDIGNDYCEPPTKAEFDQAIDAALVQTGTGVSGGR